jgi:hypothetical protein
MAWYGTAWHGMDSGWMDGGADRRHVSVRTVARYHLVSRQWSPRPLSSTLRSFQMGASRRKLFIWRPEVILEPQARLAAQGELAAKQNGNLALYLRIVTSRIEVSEAGKPSVRKLPSYTGLIT